MSENLIQRVVGKIKRVIGRITKPFLKITLVVFLIVVIIFGGATYVVKKDDGTFKEGDWSNTQYGASQRNSGVSIGSDGKITANMTAKELWEKLLDEDSRVKQYLSNAEELLKLMNAEVITQYLDTRPNPDEEIDWDKLTDITSNDIQGIIKLKRATDDGKTSTMTYVDPETFQKYIDDYNSSGSESARDKALSHFTLEKTTVASTTGQMQTIDGVDMETLTTNGKVTFYNGDGSAMEGGSNNALGWALEDGQVACKKGYVPYNSVIYIQTADSGEGSYANGKFFYVTDTGGGLQDDQIDVYAKVSADKLLASPYGTYNGATISLVEENVSWEDYKSKYYNKTLKDDSSDNDNNSSSDDSSSNKTNSEGSSKNSSSSILKWPTDVTTVTSNFGGRNAPTTGASTNHKGIDIGVSVGTNVYACEAGTVTTAGHSSSAGNWVVIDHGNGYISKYMHNSELKVSAGDKVEKGQIIALSGNSGISTGPHLHFQIEYNGEAVDPLSFKYDNGMGNGTGGIGGSSGDASTTQYYAKVATWTETTVKVETNDPEVKEYSETTYNMTTTNINYQELVKAYTMPFEFLWDILVVTQDKDFVMDLADLVYNSKIEITVHDNLSVNTQEDKYVYTRKEKVRTTKANVSVSYQGGSESFSKTSGFQDKVYDTKCETTKTTITKVNTLDIALTKADVWIVDYEKEYKYEGEKKGKPQTGDAEKIDNVEYEKSDSIDTDRNGDGASFRQQKESEYKGKGYQNVKSSLTSVSCDVWKGVYDITEQITNTTDTKLYTSSPGVVEEKTDKKAKEPNFVNTLLKISNLKAKRYLIGISGGGWWLIDILAGNESTADMVDLTKYLLYKASGNSQYWDPDTPFDFSIFDPDNFASNSGGTSGIDGVPGQIYDFLLGKGVPAIGAAAIVGNIHFETGGTFDSSLVNGIGASGLCQWYQGRLNTLKSFATSRGKDWTDVETQLEFLWKELNSSYKSVKNVIMSATTESDLEYATWYFGRYYEVYFTGTWPASKSKSAKRYEYAQKYYEQYQKYGTSAGGTVYYQGDYANVAYGNSTIAKSGCGPTAFAMVASDYTGKRITPADAVAWCGNKYYSSGAGTSWAYFTAAAKHFNLPGSVIETTNIDTVIANLRNGNLVICSQGAGLFTSGGHIIVLSSVDSSGGIKVRDPNRKNAVTKGFNNRTFTKEEIDAAAKNYWIYKRN